MQITDAHVHFWDTEQRSHPWLEGEPELNGPRLPEHLDLDVVPAPGVTSMVLIEAGCLPAQAVSEARWFASLTEQQPRIAAIVAAARLDSPQLTQRLDELAGLDLVTGVRHLFQGLPDGSIMTDAMVAGAAELASRGLAFDACIRSQQLPELIEFVKAVPELRIVLDHLGKPPIAAGEIEPWRTGLQTLAECPNVVAKLSGMAPEADPGRELLAQLRPFATEMVRIWGPDRLLLGSDWPVSTSGVGASSYPAWWDFLLSEVLAGLDADELDRVTHRNADQTYLPKSPQAGRTRQEEGQG